MSELGRVIPVTFAPTPAQSQRAANSALNSVFFSGVGSVNRFQMEAEGPPFSVFESLLGNSAYLLELLSPPFHTQVS